MPGKIVKLLGIEAGKGAQTPGAEDGPYALRQQGLVERLKTYGHEVEDLGDIPGVYETRFWYGLAENINNLPNILQVNRHSHACILGTRRKTPNAFMLVVGGDHSLAIGTLAGFSDACKRLGLLWIDAHADFNTPASSPSGNIHGMSLAVACGKGPLALRSIADRDPMVLEEDVFLCGPRDVDAGERRALGKSKIARLSTTQFRKAGIVKTALEAGETLKQRCDHVHLSFDIDVLDPAHVPGTGTRVPGGLTPEEVLEMLTALGRQGVIASAEFVEYNPKLDPEGKTGKLMIALIEALLAG